MGELLEIKTPKFVGSGYHQNLRGLRIGRLFVFKRIAPGDGRTYYVCKCSCGTVRRFRADALTSRRAKSCGCWNQEVRAMNGRRNRTHGLTHSGVYNSWRAMIQRCTNPKHDAFPHYGGRGIVVCRRWRTFENFYADMGTSWFSGASIERRDVNGDYRPENCKWLPMSEQQRNKRNVG